MFVTKPSFLAICKRLFFALVAKESLANFIKTRVLTPEITQKLKSILKITRTCHRTWDPALANLSSRSVNWSFSAYCLAPIRLMSDLHIMLCIKPFENVLPRVANILNYDVNQVIEGMESGKLTVQFHRPFLRPGHAFLLKDYHCKTRERVAIINNHYQRYPTLL